MRIIGGKLKGKRIKTLPKRDDTKLLRPTTDRVKESVFSILNNYLEGTTFLDLFAGSGNVGIEALSRGAGKVIFVENDKRFCNLIKENLKKLGIEKDRYEVICDDYVKALKKLAKRGMVFDFIYADPPYEKGFYTRIVNMVKNLGLLDRDGLLILEEPKKHPFLPEDEKWIVERRGYGTTLVTFVNFHPEEEENV
ncbi:16S rRNA (guanine(966)-N(2))-methyltransferase RsmD [Desulfurobacterium pacificum]|jgi:16S rRNA (guanine966-N2)-methyltransferase|uniref:16S rRNA (Guanine(966)-N(2))-methyltransferase RsmD n=1 Tax=Desulfurobacterium pacificum TaxID=240166 RepID=A0ABY1N8G4_9BACT|nr:16S rRNA (guanine(966)-N(2))-methyltransferase RsmD [Desulfurobacterium pacificum]SMP02874.1 16S rRNA (guanine(966)-N(2))-methyltransferase RsmD [Desulfurobacterium pacificum]